MKITIDYNGTYAVCNVTDFHSPWHWVNFNETNKMTQVYALSAFKCIEEHYKLFKLLSDHINDIVIKKDCDKEYTEALNQVLSVIGKSL